MFPLRRCLCAVLLPFLAAVACSADALDPASGALARLDPLWDERVGFLWSPTADLTRPDATHSVRDTGWYAVALLQRDQPGDRDRAARALRAILTQQIDAPGEPWHATYYRAPEERHIPLFPEAWRDYDVNWRQFIGVAFALCLIEFEDRLPTDLPPQLLASLERALAGELAQDRLRPDYTNIALMQAFLLDFAGERLDRPAWRTRALALAESVAAAYDAHGAFEEFNSPTYYGVDFLGLSLWRKYAPAPAIRALGARLEAALWRDTAAFYHAGLRNLCGPYDRSYGMDMQRYASLLGLWLRLELPPEIAPFPALDDPAMGHRHDFNYAALFSLIGTAIPDDVRSAFTTFAGPRFVERALPRGRTATAWLDHTFMLGATETGFSRGAGGEHNQLHPVTIHWRQPDGSIGWILLTDAPRLNARAAERRLHIEAIGNLTFRVHCAPDQATLAEGTWTLPGLHLALDHDARTTAMRRLDDGYEVSFTAATQVTFTVVEP